MPVHVGLHRLALAFVLGPLHLMMVMMMMVMMVMMVVMMMMVLAPHLDHLALLLLPLPLFPFSPFPISSLLVKSVTFALLLLATFPGNIWN